MSGDHEAMPRERPSRPVGLVVLTPAEAKRLIAKGVAALPPVRRALRQGRIIIAPGTTNACVAEELLGITVDHRLFASGIVTPRGLDRVPPALKLPFMCIVDGRQVDRPLLEVLNEFTAEDVFIKGANAIDPTGAVGILIGNDTGGIGGGKGFPFAQARGAYFVVPVGLEKMIPSVAEAARHCGIGRTVFCTGNPSGLIPVTSAVVVTEVEALRLLCDVTAYHIASGGVQGAEGSVTLALEI